MSEREKLLSEIDAFLARTGMTQAMLGTRCMHDNKIVPRLRQGKDCTLATADRLRAFMANFQMGNGRQMPDPVGAAA